MTEGLVFLHLSDIHFHRKSGNKYDLDADLRNELELDIKRVQAIINKPVDAVLVTGDIVFSGKKEEYEIASAWLDKIAGLINCKPNRIWTVPGNHDVDRSIISESKLVRHAHDDIRALPSAQLGTELARFLQGSDAAMIFRPFEAYNSFARRFVCTSEPNALCWEQKLILKDGVELRLRGLNSALLSSKEDTPGNLILGLFQIPPRMPAVVYLTLCHHPPDWLLDEAEVEPYLKSRISIQLFGHIHKHRIQRGDRFLRIVAGAVHPERGDVPFAPAYDFFTIDFREEGANKKLLVRVFPRIWDHDDTCFRADSKEGTENGYFVEYEVLVELTGEVSAVQIAERTAALGKDAIQVTFGEQPALEVVMGDTKATARELFYRYYKLPYHRRIEIAQKLKLLEDADENLPDLEKFRKVLNRVAEMNKLPELADEVERAEKQA